MRSTPTWRLLAAVGAASLVLTACGGEDGEAEPETPIAEGDGTLVIGTVLPQTGSLAFLGPPEFAGVDLAIKDINAGGGVLGQQVKVVHGDSGDTTTDIASQTVDTLLRQNADVIIGAASSSVSLTIIDKIVGSGVVHFSPANTSPAFTTYEDKGLYFRTAPSDVLQGRVLGDLVLADGNATTGMLVLQDAYGVGLADNAEKAITDGGGEVLEKGIYDPKAAEFSADVAKIKAANPDAIILIGFDETSKIIPELVKQGLRDKKWYFVDGNLSNYGDELPKGTLTDFKGTLPGAETKSDFQDRLLEVNPRLRDFSYAPESYDATILSALAAEAAQNDSGTAIASKLIEVSKDGEKCTTFADCKALLDEGTDIDYDGVSGPIEFSDAGDPSEATIGIYQYDENNNYTNVEFRSGKV
jgi:ABC-type branched-subunit amino acid transport system substrate-binding protein